MRETATARMTGLAGRRAWPWLVLLALTVPAVWHAVDFPDDVDPEFPRVARPTFSRRPPPAYRLAEPGDTIDRVGLYLSAGAVVLSGIGLAIGRGRTWTSALALSGLAVWYAATPGPTFDGWHGLGWRSTFNPSAPIGLRGPLALGWTALWGVVAAEVWSRRSRLAEWVRSGGRVGVAGLLVASAVLCLLRQFQIPGVEPVGYWPRWAFVWGIAAFDLALIQGLGTLDLGRGRSARRLGLAGVVAWGVIVASGIGLTWYHRPLARLRTVEPGKIYISAMPTYAGLKVAYQRHPFKTIINVFAEETDQRSPILPDELRFVREHGIHYLNAPPEQSKADAFLDETLRLAQDPDAWPILVHCHGCMDRSPAWMGIYRFLVQGVPLEDVFREIEGHRGYRPKASVTLLYNRVLPARSPSRYLADPTGRLLLESARGTIDPFDALSKREGNGTSRR